MLFFLTVASLATAVAAAVWPPAGVSRPTAFIPAPCTSSFDGALADATPLNLTITLVSLKQQVTVDRGAVSRNAHGLKLASQPLCRAEEFLRSLLYKLRSLPQLAMLRQLLQRDAATGDHCVLLLPNAHIGSMLHSDTAVLRDLLLVAGARAVHTVVVTEHKPLHDRGLWKKGKLALEPLDVRRFYAVMIARFTAAEMLAHACPQVMLEVAGGGQRKCAKLDVQRLGTVEGRRRSYRVQHLDPESFRSHYEWLHSLLAPTSCPSSLEALSEDTCHWVHAVPSGGEVLGNDEWAYAASNAPFYGNESVGALPADVMAAAWGWGIHPGFHFLTPTGFDPPPTVADHRPGVFPIPLVGPLGVEGTGHHMIQDVVGTSPASASMPWPAIVFMEGGLKEDYGMSMRWGKLAGLVLGKHCIAAGISLGGAMEKGFRRSGGGDIGFDPLLTAHSSIRGWTVSFPDGVRKALHYPGLWRRLYPNVVLMAQVAASFNESLNMMKVGQVPCNAEQVSTAMRPHCDTAQRFYTSLYAIVSVRPIVAPWQCSNYRQAPPTWPMPLTC